MEGTPPPALPPEGRAPSPLPRPRQFSAIGGLLVLIGVILLLAQFVPIDLGHYGWPFLIIVPGVALLVLALVMPGFVSEGLAIAGSVISITGLILLYQNSTDHFESWAYAWALVFPAAVGIGMMLYGVFHDRPGNVRIGSRLLGIGVVLFLLGAAFFEGVLGIGGYNVGHSGGVVLGVLIIAVGALLLIVNVFSRRSPSSKPLD